MYKHSKIGFTLSETLIVLAIIGVIAAMTLPTLYTGQEEMQRMTSLKKVYSAFQINIQNTLSSQNEDGSTICETFSCLNSMEYVDGEVATPDGGKHNGILANPQRIHILNECDNCASIKQTRIEKSTNEAGEEVEVEITEFVGNGDMPTEFNITADSGSSNFSVYMLRDNSMIAIQDFRGNCQYQTDTVTELVKEESVVNGEITANETVVNGKIIANETETEVNIPLCGILLIDVNGPKGPNTAGRDRYAYYIADRAVDNNYLIPMGYKSFAEDSKPTPGSADYHASAFNAGYKVKSLTNSVFDITAKVMQKGWSYTKK